MSQVPISSNAKPSCDRADALAVVQRLREAGHIAYFAGGCVRDLLLGLSPKDFDVATDAPPQRVRELFSNTQAVGQAFGVILVRHRKSVIEVATFRSDGRYEDGRHPAEVRFTTAEEDAQRRDFTVNGLFLDPLDNRVIDFVGGQKDLDARLLRAIGDPEKRFDEDYLRLLRAVRFAARFDFTIDPHTRAAIQSHAAKLKQISPERIAEELRIMLTPPTRRAAWKLLQELGLADEVFRLWNPAKADPSRPLWKAFEVAALFEVIPFGLSLAAAYVSRADEVMQCLQIQAIRDAVRSTRQMLKISNEESDQMSRILLGAGLMLQSESLTLAQKKRFLARATSRESRLLLQAIADVGFFADRINTLLAELGELQKTDFAPLPLVTGDDLTAAQLQPGPAFKKVLDCVYDEQLEGRVIDKTRAMQLALEIYQRERKG